LLRLRLIVEFAVYWTVHHLDNWRIKSN